MRTRRCCMPATEKDGPRKPGSARYATVSLRSWSLDDAQFPWHGSMAHDVDLGWGGTHRTACRHRGRRYVNSGECHRHTGTSGYGHQFRRSGRSVGHQHRSLGDHRRPRGKPGYGHQRVPAGAGERGAALRRRGGPSGAVRPGRGVQQRRRTGHGRRSSAGRRWSDARSGRLHRFVDAGAHRHPHPGRAG